MNTSINYLGGLVEELALTSLLCLLLLLEESIVNLGSINTLEVDLGGCSQSVSLVHSLEGDTVDLVGAGDEEQTGGELLEEDNASAAEATGEEDQNGAGGNALSELGGLGLGGLLVVLLLVFSGVPNELFDHLKIPIEQQAVSVKNEKWQSLPKLNKTPSYSLVKGIVLTI